MALDFWEKGAAVLAVAHGRAAVADLAEMLDQAQAAVLLAARADLLVAAAARAKEVPLRLAATAQQGALELFLELTAHSQAQTLLTFKVF